MTASAITTAAIAAQTSRREPRRDMPDLTRALPVGADVRLVSPSVLFRERAGTWANGPRLEPSYACGGRNGAGDDAASSSGLTCRRDHEALSTFAGSVLRTR